MSIKVMATVDLKVTSSKERQDFYKHLLGEKWTKIQGLTTAWYASFEEGINAQNCLTTSINDFEAAAQIAGIQRANWKVAFMVSEEKPTIH